MFHHPTIRIILAASMLGPLGTPGQADTVKLKSGKVYDGQILSEDASSLTLEYEVSRGIKDEIRLAKADIAGIEKENPAAKAWSDLTKDQPPADLLAAKDYDRMIAKADAFLRANPAGSFATKAKKLLESLRDERDRVNRGDLKLGGKWITKDEYQRDKFWIDGAIALQRMAQFDKAGRFIDAMRQYESIEDAYAGTTIHARAITLANSCLKKYAGVIQEAIAACPILLEQRAKRLKTLPPPESRASEEAQIAEDKAYLEKIEEEKKSGTRWLSLSPFNLAELTKAQKSLQDEAARIAAIDTSDAATVEHLLREIDKAIGEGRLAAAATLVQQANQSLKKSPFLKSLEDRVKAELARIAEEKKTNDAALKEAARLARASLPKTTSAGDTNKEPDPIDEGMSPVAKAVRQSQLGQRVAGPGETAAPPTGSPADAPTPAPAPEQPSVAVPSATSAPSAAGQENIAPAETPSQRKSERKPAGKAIDYALYGVAAALALALVGLLLAPLFKKKPLEQTPAPDQESGESTEDEPSAEDEFMSAIDAPAVEDVDAEELTQPQAPPRQGS